MQAKHFIFILLGIIVIETIFIIARKPDTVVKAFDDTPLRKKIDEANEKAHQWQTEAARQKHIADSALTVNEETKILYIKAKNSYDKIYRSIPGSSNHELDSIVRAEIGKKRYTDLLQQR